MLLLGLACALALVVGCAGSYFNWSQARQVKQGMTTAEVTQIMGKPMIVQTLGTDGKKLKYIWAYGTGLGSGGSFTIIFEDGKATQVPVIPDEFK